MRKNYRNFNNHLFKQTDTIYYMWDEKPSVVWSEVGSQLIASQDNRTFGSTTDWLVSTVNGTNTNNDFATATLDTSSGATEGTYFTDNYLKIICTSDSTDIKYLVLDNHTQFNSLQVGKKYRLSYSYEITSYTSGSLEVGVFPNDMISDDVSSYGATATAQTGYVDFIYSSTLHKKIGIKAVSGSAFTAYFDNFSLRQIQESTSGVTKYIGIHPTPSTSSKTIRYHYVVEPTAMSSDTDVIEIDEDYEKAVIYGASAELAKRLRALDFTEYDPMAQRLLGEYEIEKDKALRHSIDRDSERFVKIDYRDY